MISSIGIRVFLSQAWSVPGRNGSPCDMRRSSIRIAISLPNAKVLDLASHDGRWSYAALCAGAAHVTGIEVRSEPIAAANETMRYYGISEDKYRFIQGDINQLTESSEIYDVVLCLGYFYHTLNYLQLFEYIQSTHASHIILDGSITPGNGPIITVYEEHIANPSAGWAGTGLRDSPTSSGVPERAGFANAPRSCRL